MTLSIKCFCFFVFLTYFGKYDIIYIHMLVKTNVKKVGKPQKERFKMIRIDEIRSAVEILASLTDEEWEAVDIILQKREGDIILPTKEVEEEDFDNKREFYLRKLLKQIGMPSNIKGYYFIKRAIILVWDEPQLRESVTKGLYPRLAEEFNTTSSRIERAIRHAIEVAWQRGEYKLIDRIFSYSVDSKRGKATNSQAIFALSEYAKLYMP